MHKHQLVRLSVAVEPRHRFGGTAKGDAQVGVAKQNFASGQPITSGREFRTVHQTMTRRRIRGVLNGIAFRRTNAHHLGRRVRVVAERGITTEAFCTNQFLAI